MTPADIARSIQKFMDGEHDARLSADIEVKPGPASNCVQLFAYSGEEGHIVDRFMISVTQLRTESGGF